ncbi:unnamed protein product [Owenia fusiformis]|nr:unnamed protein product [Owenia fusiformis]
MVKIQDLEAAEMTADAEKLVKAILKGESSHVSDVIKEFKSKGKPLETVVKTKLSINDLRSIQNVSESNTALISWIALSGLKTMTPFHIAGLVDGRTIVEVFLEETNIDVDYRTPDNITILHLASFAGYLALVETLVNVYKADLTLEDDWGRVATHYAAAGGHLAVVKYLVSKKADPIVRDKAGRTAVMYAWDKQKYDVVEYLQTFDGGHEEGHVPMYGTPQGEFVRLPFNAGTDPVDPPKEVFRSNPIYDYNAEAIETNMKAMNVGDNTAKEGESTSDDILGPATQMHLFERPAIPKDNIKHPNPEDTEIPPWKHYDIPPRKVFTKAELAKRKKEAEKRKSKKKHKLYDELDKFPDYSDHMYADEEPQYPFAELHPQPMQQYFDPQYYYDDQAPAYPIYTQSIQRNIEQRPPLFSYQEDEYPEPEREIIYTIPQPSTSEPVRVIQDPQRIIQEPQRIIQEPPRIIREQRVINEPPRVIREPPRVIREPPRVIHEPPRVIHEPSRVIHEPSRVIYGPSRVIHEPPISRAVSHRPDVIEERREVLRPHVEVMRRPTTRVLPDGVVVQQYPIQPPENGIPTRTIRKIPPPRQSERDGRRDPYLYGQAPGPTQELYRPPQDRYSRSSSNYVRKSQNEDSRRH